MNAKRRNAFASTIGALEISDAMCADALAYVYDSGRLQAGWAPSQTSEFAGSFGVEGSDGVWVVGLIRVVLASVSRELKKRDCAT